MKFFITFSLLLLSFPSLAQDVIVGGEPEGPGITSLLVQLVIIFAIFYFILIKPQQKKLKQHKLMTQGLKKGDKIVTAGGIVGVIARSKEDENIVDIEIADGVTVKILRSTIGEILEMRDKPEEKDDKKLIDDKKKDKKKKDKK